MPVLRLPGGRPRVVLALHALGAAAQQHVVFHGRPIGGHGGCGGKRELHLNAFARVQRALQENKQGGLALLGLGAPVLQANALRRFGQAHSAVSFRQPHALRDQIHQEGVLHGRLGVFIVMDLHGVDRLAARQIDGGLIAGLYQAHAGRGQLAKAVGGGVLRFQRNLIKLHAHLVPWPVFQGGLGCVGDFCDGQHAAAAFLLIQLERELHLFGRKRQAKGIAAGGLQRRGAVFDRQPFGLLIPVEGDRLASLAQIAGGALLDGLLPILKAIEAHRGNNGRVQHVIVGRQMAGLSHRHLGDGVFPLQVLVKVQFLLPAMGGEALVGQHVAVQGIAVVVHLGRQGIVQRGALA